MPVPETQPINEISDVLQDVKIERLHQLVKWGAQTHSLPVWSSILGEEVGELCKEINELHFNYDEKRLDFVYSEAIQVAAVAAAIAQYVKKGRA